MRTRHNRSLVAALLIASATLAASCSTTRHSSAQVATTTAPTAARAATSTCVLPAPISTLSTAQLARMTIVDPVDEASVATLSSQVKSGIGGIILFGSDGTQALSAQLAALMKLAPAGRAPFVMVDEEGGSVQRLLSLVGNVPAARTMGATMTPAQIEQLASVLGKKMRALGITMDLAPVVDLDAGNGPNSKDADGTRSFSLNPTVTGNDALAFAKGLLAAKVAPVFKHFPGLGGATANTDLAKASTKPYAGLNSAPIAPFRVAIRAGMPAVMISNAQVPRLTSLPAGLSAAVVTSLLRSQLGFSGLVLTDSLTADSIPQSGFSLRAAAVAAIQAGADEVLFNALPADVATDNAVISSALVQAVVEKKLPRGRLIAAARDAERVKAEVGAC